MIPEEAIAEVRERTDILAVIGEYVRLKKRGNNHVGLCPFHNEKSPSFNVHGGRGFFHCFGCKASGDAIAFLMRIEGVTFPQAARLLADRVGLDLPAISQTESEAERTARTEREHLLAIMEHAARFFEQALERHPQAQSARDELARRGISTATAGRFRLGFAPPAWSSLADFLEKKGVSLIAAERLGLVVPRKRQDGFYDRFRNRLQFPITDPHGQVVGFSGRILPAPAGAADDGEAREEPKYVNSPEGPLYHKGELLFGLHQGRVALRRKTWAILCEGNFDLVALAEAGFDNVVAPLGTALTVRQANLLARYVQRVTVLFDGDGAGQKAAIAAYPLLRKARLSGRVVQLPAGEDPDSFLRAKGPEVLQSLMDNAPGMVEHVIDFAAEQCAGRDAGQRAQAIQELAPVLAAATNPVERDIYVERLAQRFGVRDLDILKEQLKRGHAAVVQEMIDEAAADTEGQGDESRWQAVRRLGPALASVKKREEIPLLVQRVAKKFAIRDVEAVKRELRQGVLDQKRTSVSGAVQSFVARPNERVKMPPLQVDVIGVLIDQPSLLLSDDAKKLEELLTSPELRGMFRTAAALIQQNGDLDVPALLSKEKDNRALSQLRERFAVCKYPDRSDAELALAAMCKRLEAQKIQEERSRLVKQIQEARRNGDNELANHLTKQRDELGVSASQLADGKR